MQQARHLGLQIHLKRTQALPINSGRTLVALDMSESLIQTLLRQQLSIPDCKYVLMSVVLCDDGSDVRSS